ncbi:hypothetical protein [Lactococcus lactis]|uniref:hypothetical protein n=1 Tax=Lactococcus lactis TaxID=1358 RepID=UPI000BA79724|nr:hypothetical protein [Lactococcus lactis]PAK67800.1 hypothetical protein B8W94_03795 [Lactococcus lactis]PEN17732.1 hypothetical protein CRM88_12625 [Lactococcus lactis]TYR17217.1 hypothetical protein FYK05_13095 [Lactococcus lactis subsp. lactis bv. diacetylactis]
MLNKDAVKKLNKNDKEEFDKLMAEYTELFKDRLRATKDIQTQRADINMRIATFCTEHKLLK